MNLMNKFFFRVHVISALMILSAGYLNAQNLDLIPYPDQLEVYNPFQPDQHPEAIDVKKKGD